MSVNGGIPDSRAGFLKGTGGVSFPYERIQSLLFRQEKGEDLERERELRGGLWGAPEMLPKGAIF